MRTKLLFVTAHMQMNGAAKSLLNLLHALDRERYEIHLLVFSWGDVLMAQIPSDITLLPEHPVLRGYDLSFWAAMRYLVGRGNLYWALERAALGVAGKLFDLTCAKEKLWRFVRPFDDGYDVAIAYNEGVPQRFTIDRVVAKKKVGYVHMDMSYAGNKALHAAYYTDFDRIVAVSQICRDSLVKHFSVPEDKIAILYNLIGDGTIRRQAGTAADLAVGERPLLVTVGRLARDKGFDLAVEAASLLRDAGIVFRWLFIGEGHARPILEKRIAELNLNGHVRLIGMLENPYPVILQADVYVQPSRSESWGISLTEAKILGRPIVATRIPAFCEQIESGENGLLVECGAKELFEGIRTVLADAPLRSRFSRALVGFESGDSSRLQAFDRMIESLRINALRKE